VSLFACSRAVNPSSVWQALFGIQHPYESAIIRHPETRAHIFTIPDNSSTAELSSGSAAVTASAHAC
jgi:hypothetical protein